MGAEVKAVIGVDPSMTSTGLCDAFGNVRTYGGDERKGDRRLELIGGAIYASVSDALDLAVVEDLYPGARGGVTTAMVQGVVRYELMRADVPYAMVAPMSLKLYATGSGTANKSQMAVAAYKWAEIEFLNDDECDSWWLRTMGLDFLGEPLFGLPAGQRKALDKVKWPVLP
jgi:Holliday junction resolvasome RuvABC endonuclease subunit